MEKKINSNVVLLLFEYNVLCHELESLNVGTRMFFFVALVRVAYEGVNFHNAHDNWTIEMRK